MATHCLRAQSCNLVSSHLQSAHTLLVESSSHRNLHQFPLFDPATPCPQHSPTHIKTNPPPRSSIAALCFLNEAILLLKNPLLEDGRFEFRAPFYSYFFPFLYLLLSSYFFHYFPSKFLSSLTHYYIIINGPSGH